MIVNTFSEAKKTLLNAGFSIISGNEAFSTFGNNNGDLAFVWSNGINESDGYSIEM